MSARCGIFLIVFKSIVYLYVPSNKAFIIFPKCSLAHYWIRGLCSRGQVVQQSNERADTGAELPLCLRPDFFIKRAKMCHSFTCLMLDTIIKVLQSLLSRGGRFVILTYIERKEDALALQEMQFYSAALKLRTCHAHHHPRLKSHHF